MNPQVYWGADDCLYNAGSASKLKIFLTRGPAYCRDMYMCWLPWFSYQNYLRYSNKSARAATVQPLRVTRDQLRISLCSQQGKKSLKPMDSIGAWEAMNDALDATGWKQNICTCGQSWRRKGILKLSIRGRAQRLSFFLCWSFGTYNYLLLSPQRVSFHWVPPEKSLAISLAKAKRWASSRRTWRSHLSPSSTNTYMNNGQWRHLRSHPQLQLVFWMIMWSCLSILTAS